MDDLDMKTRFADRQSSILFGLAVTSLLSLGGRLQAAEVPTPGLSAAELREGWISLFDGKTLYGWKPNSDLNWRVDNGTITADKGRPGLLLTTFQLADYQLRLEYQLERGGN